MASRLCRWLLSFRAAAMFLVLHTRHVKVLFLRLLVAVADLTGTVETKALATVGREQSDFLAW